MRLRGRRSVGRPRDNDCTAMYKGRCRRHRCNRADPLTRRRLIPRERCEQEHNARNNQTGAGPRGVSGPGPHGLTRRRRESHPHASRISELRNDLDRRRTPKPNPSHVPYVARPGQDPPSDFTHPEIVTSSSRSRPDPRECRSAGPTQSRGRLSRRTDGTSSTPSLRPPADPDRGRTPQSGDRGAGARVRRGSAQRSPSSHADRCKCPGRQRSRAAHP